MSPHAIDELTVAFHDHWRATLPEPRGGRAPDAAARTACAERILRDKLWQHRAEILALVLEAIP